MIQLLKNHKWAVIFALLAGLIVAFPQIYFSYNNADQYQGIYVATTDNEFSYLARIQEVRDGHFGLGNAISKDGKEDPYIQAPLGEILIAYLGKIFFLDLNGSILLARVLFTFLIFLCIYGLVFLFTKKKTTAVAAAIAVCLAKSLLSRGGIMALLSGGSPTTLFLDFYRPVQPQASTLFFFAFLLLFWIFFDTSTQLSVKKRRFFGIVSALILGSSFYIYPYTWSFLYVFLGVLCLILLFQRKWPDVKRIILLALGGIIIAIPYFLNIYKSTLQPYFVEVSRRFGLVETHQLVLGFLVPSLFVIFLLFFPRKWRERYVFSLALLIAPFIVLNQQLITGRDFHSGHYHWFIHQPLAIIFLVIIAFYWAEKLLKKAYIPKILTLLVIGASIYTGTIIQAASYNASRDQILYDQRYSPVIKWFNAHAQKDEVFLADPHQGDVLSVYTPLNAFYNYRSCIYFSASNERIINALFLFYRLNGLAGEDAKDLFFQKQERYRLVKDIYGIYYRDMVGDAAGIPDEVLLSLVEKYKDFLRIPLDMFLVANDVEYITWDTKNYPRWQLDQYSFLDNIYNEGDFKIYQIVKK